MAGSLATAAAQTPEVDPRGVNMNSTETVARTSDLVVADTSSEFLVASTELVTAPRNLVEYSGTSTVTVTQADGERVPVQISTVPGGALP
jgi:hypothetical protein